MHVLILNQILYTPENNNIPKINSIKDTMIYGMCYGFLKNGHKITLAAAEEYKPLQIENYPFEIKFFKSNLIKFFPPNLLPFSIELLIFLRKNSKKYDVVLSSETFSFSSLFASLICHQKTIIWQEQNNHQKKFNRIPSIIWHRIIAPLFLTRCNAIIPRSTSAYTFIAKYMNNVTKNVIDHGIDAQKFSFTEIKKRQIISSSQLIYRKNISGIIDVFNKLHVMRGYEDIKLIIAGRGDQEIKLKEKVLNMGLTDSVIFIGFLNHYELNEYIRESMAFLINTRQDLNVVSIPEAIVSGTPVLTNCKPASSDYVSKNELGIAMNNWTEKELKKIIDNCDEYSQNCREFRKNLTNINSAFRIIEEFQKNENYSC